MVFILATAGITYVITSHIEIYNTIIYNDTNTTRVGGRVKIWLKELNSNRLGSESTDQRNENIYGKCNVFFQLSSDIRKKPIQGNQMRSWEDNALQKEGERKNQEGAGMYSGN